MKDFFKILAVVSLAIASVVASPLNVSPVQENIFARADTVGNKCDKLDDYSPKDSLDVFPVYDAERSEMMRYRFHIGVNLGSWFVAEKWMVPSLFDCVLDGEKGDLAIARGYGTSHDGIKSARARLEKHWDTWITKDDFAHLKQVGVNAVRIPIGYWNLPDAKYLKDTPFENYTEVYKNSWKYVRRAIKYANDNDIGVLLDLHGAYGSQNGQEKSGFNKFDVNFYKGDNRNRTTKALSWIVRDLQDMPNMIGLELLNEAKNSSPEDRKLLMSWYKNALDTIRQIGDTTVDFPLYISDSFSPQQAADIVDSRKDFVAQDTHRYFAFTNKHQSVSEIIDNVKTSTKKTMKDISDKVQDRYIVGEWSCALDPASLSSDKSKDEQLSDFCNAEISTYRNVTAGMFFWSYRFQHCDSNIGWCFRAARGDFFNKYNAWGFYNNETSKVVDRVNQENLDLKHQLALKALFPNPRDLGYAEGFTWAKKLAKKLPVSRLGFKEEYVARRTQKNKDKLHSDSDREDFHDGYLEGVAYIECIVLSYKNEKSESICKKQSSNSTRSISTSNSNSSSSKTSSSSSSKTSSSSSSKTSSSSSSKTSSSSSSSSSKTSSSSSSSSSKPTSTSTSSSSSSLTSPSQSSTVVTSSVSGKTVTATASGTTGGQMCGNDDTYGFGICISGSGNGNNIN
ncbi:hypothetical protein MEQU1_003720 [Malassezia equina]|uniref:Glycoside hydrolase family 5 domain-containing protein n=1 Tax=Malassezia equina TaxID=1381935 RepID=A0AAF0J0I1_9BASI|nr:hypothetical protein MEQU1_003720 [Malassezia equina]